MRLIRAVFVVLLAGAAVSATSASGAINTSQAGASPTLRGALSPGLAHGLAHGLVPGLARELGRALYSPHVDMRQTGALAVDVQTGQVLFERNADLPLIPASAEKLAVAYSALRKLGPRFRFRTEVRGAGRIVGTEFRGDLVLVGDGDPTLAVTDVGRLARDLVAAGIRRVTGGVVADETHFDSLRTAPGWKPSFLGIESPPLSALVVNGVPVTTANGSALVAAGALTAALARRGVVLLKAPRTGRAPAAATRIAADHSAKLAVLVHDMNLVSDNFVAEMLLKELGASANGQGSTRGGAQVVRRTLAEADVPVAGLRVADGSGLSRLDRVSPRTLVALLQAAAADRAVGKILLASLPVAGVSGTLAKRLDRPPTLRRVAAKTGTTSRACALAGFVGRRYVFAILQNGSPLAYWYARAAQDRFVTVLARS